MAKFNTKSVDNRKMENKEGGVSYKRTFEKELVSIVFNSMLNGDKYYETEQERIDNLFQLISDNVTNEEKARFLAKTIVYTRKELGLRSITHLLAVALTEKVKGKSFVRKTIFNAVIRPDDMIEMFALYTSRNDKAKMTNAMRKAFKEALETKFDAYQMKKYANNKNSVKLKDIVKLVRPNPKNFKDKNIFKKVIEDKLANIQTAQTVNATSTNEDRAMNYENMLLNRKLGIMASLKNIKNMLEAKISNKAIDSLISLLTNENAVKNSKILPFRFYDAYRIVENINYDRIKIKKVLKAIETGFKLSAKNIPIIDENQTIALLLDESGSMISSATNSLTAFDVGKVLMASTLTGLNKDNAVGYLWADNAREVNIDDSPMNFIKRTQRQGYGTYVSAAFEGLIKSKTKVDVVVIFTDMQLYGRQSFNETIDKYIKQYSKVNGNTPKIVWWNLVGYGKSGVPTMRGNVMEVAGYSDKMLGIVGKMLKYSDSNYLIKEIDNYIDL